MMTTVAVLRLQKLSLSKEIIRTRVFNGIFPTSLFRGDLSVTRSLSISRMLDMGGMPSASNDRTPIRTINASKNSKLQAVAFDFEILIKSSPGTDSSSNNININNNNNKSATPPKGMDSSDLRLNTRPTADLDQINQVANLLKVDINADSPTFKNPYKESVSSFGNTTGTTSLPTPPSPPKPKLPKTAPHEDVRAKYARKLKGGLAGIELAKSQVEESLAKGDAAGHLAARKMVMQDTPPHSSGGSRWMANSAASKLLTYLTHRSIRIVLLPDPKRVGNAEKQQQEQDWMRDFQTQLRDVVIDVAVPSLQSADEATLSQTLQKNVLNELSMDPALVLVVSDRDDYLKTAKDLGMLTCRLQPKNARRGNITAHFTSPSVDNVQEIVNEINGISFNAVLNR
ncbi:hypothetical protein IV203_026246 [Nitzschia inconspicua]|uniref:Uncharacterized protein n=1 Tax=Nitzschia inconspicua TaxID=303405 RepID=A0A9K3LLB5_9STRA|nr:hypothetical protein IV203_026246 [Nitzschia inconspicua]